jgi:hypothetical protein
MSRRRNTRGALAVLVALALTGYVGPAAPGSPRTAPGEGASRAGLATCSADALPTLGGPGGNVLSAAPDGTLVGLADDTAGRSLPVLWRRGAVRALETGLQQAVPAGVNGDGTVVGSAYDRGRDATVGWAWRAGRTRVLDADTGESTAAEAVDRTGRIVGAVEMEEQEQAVVWDDAGSAPRVLAPLPGDEGGHAFAVASDGTVGGVSLGDGGRPTVWTAEGTPIPLDAPAGGGMVLGFDGPSRPVGVVYLPDGSSSATAWELDGSSSALQVAASDSRSGGAVTSSAGEGTAGGGVLGTATRSGGMPRAVVWDRHGAPAAVLMPALRRGFHGAATVANDSGRLERAPVLVGYSADRRGLRVPTVWRCP